MIIALKKQLQIRDNNLNIINVNHWVVTDVIHRVDKEFAVISIDGYTNRQSRLDEELPVVNNVRYKIKNTYDENGDIINNAYNKFIRYVSVTANAKHKDYMKESVLEFLATIPDFSDAVND